MPCKKGAASGTINSSREQTLTLTYKECIVPPKTAKKFSGPVLLTGQGCRRSRQEALVTKLVWLDEAETVPGIWWNRPDGRGLQYAECIGGNVKVKQRARCSPGWHPLAN